MDILVPTSITEQEPPEEAEFRTTNQRVNLPRDSHHGEESLHKPMLEAGVAMHQMACGIPLLQQACPETYESDTFFLRHAGRLLKASSIDGGHIAALELTQAQNGNRSGLLSVPAFHQTYMLPYDIGP